MDFLYINKILLWRHSATGEPGTCTTILTVILSHFDIWSGSSIFMDFWLGLRLSGKENKDLLAGMDWGGRKEGIGNVKACEMDGRTDAENSNWWHWGTCVN